MSDLKKLRIGFPLARGGGGPTIFMRRLKDAVRRDNLASSSYFFDPLADILVCANSIRNPWRKPYVLRLDGIAFDLALGQSEINRRNSPVFNGINQAQGLIFQAAFSKRLIETFHPIADTPFTVIPNGIDLDEFTPDGPDMREKLRIPSEAVVFLTSAKWRGHKRLNATIEAFQRYCAITGDKAHLLVLGKLESEPLAYLQRVHYVGHIHHAELPSWYRTADVCLFFSWLDNCPNTVVEALASGLPVLCTNQGGTRELVELTEGGVVVEADHDFPFTQVELHRPPEPDQEKILSGMLDIVSRRKQLAAGIKRERLGIQTVASRYVEFLKQVYRLHDY